MDGLQFRCEAGEEVIAEFVPSLHVVGEGVGLNTLRAFNVVADPVRANGTHDVGFVPMCGDAVGGETGCEGGDHAMASLVIVVHEFVSQ